MYGFDRASISCQQQWGTLLQSYKVVRDHESHLDPAQKHSALDTMGKRSKNKLRWEFDLEMREILERIRSVKAFEDINSIQMDADPRCRSDMGLFGLTDCDELLYDEVTDSETEEIDSQAGEEESEFSSDSIQSQAEVTADSHVARITEPCYGLNANNYGRKVCFHSSEG